MSALAAAFDPAQLERVLQRFAASGVSVADWSRVRGFTAGTVYRVLRGEHACKRGQGHAIAVALGLKAGIVRSAEELDFRNENTAVKTGHSLGQQQESQNMN